MRSRPSLGILFGGRSVEHDVSILTGYQALAAVDREKFNVTPVYLARDNVWYIGRGLDSLDFFKQDHPPLNRLTRVFPCPDPTVGKLLLLEAEPRAFRKAKATALDVVLPATHGTFVEDGALQGICEMADVALAGSGVRGSAVGMDKLLTKAVLAAEGLPFLPYRKVGRDGWESEPDSEIVAIENAPGYPTVVKPAVLGSSIAVSAAKERAELREALDLALRFCERALVERGLEMPTEINCAVIDGEPPVASVLEQPMSEERLLSYDEKYRAGTKGSKGSKGMAGQQRLIPAPLDDGKTAQIQELAIRTYRAVGASGVARVDFLIDREGEVYINELNNIPGSLAFYLWERMGRSFRELIDRLVERAFEVRKRRNRTTFGFEGNLLSM